VENLRVQLVGLNRTLTRRRKTYLDLMLEFLIKKSSGKEKRGTEDFCLVLRFLEQDFDRKEGGRIFD
jgi:hypothetical protein